MVYRGRRSRVAGHVLVGHLHVVLGAVHERLGGTSGGSRRDDLGLGRHEPRQRGDSDRVLGLGLERRRERDDVRRVGIRLARVAGHGERGLDRARQRLLGQLECEREAVQDAGAVLGHRHGWRKRLPVERHDDSVRAVRPAARAGVFEQILVPVLERVDVSVKQVGVAVGVVDALDDCDVAVGGLQGREPARRAR